MTVYFMGAGPGARKAVQAKWAPVRRSHGRNTNKGAQA